MNMIYQRSGSLEFEKALIGREKYESIGGNWSPVAFNGEQLLYAFSEMALEIVGPGRIRQSRSFLRNGVLVNSEIPRKCLLPCHELI
jgi:hypothetical protein